ncbi:MAG: hypothetical protein JWO36_2919 [Myxococcales bacterium]|nr:hypothetical protein [Myxococcales bacterium]
MKNVVLGSLIALTAATGCTTTATPVDTATVSATWTLRTADVGTATGHNVSCPPGFDTAALYNQEISPTTGANIGQPFIDLFNCSAGQGSATELPPGLYQTWVEIANTNNTSVYAQSLSADVDVTVANKTFSAEILVDGGYFQLAWNLVGATSNNSLTCTQAGATGGVEAISTDVATSANSASDVFTCEDHAGVTSGFKAATYTISVDALNSQMQAIGTAPAISNRVIASPNKVTDLGTITIPITGK